MRCALYARVSTTDKGQDPMNQLRLLRDYAAKQGWTLVHEYVDQASGKNGDRAQFQAMMKDAHRRKFDCLLFYSLDRMTREGTYRTLTYLRQLTAAGVKFSSYTEQYVSSLGVFSEAIIGIIGAVAEQERVRISERTKAGLDRARAAGKRLGRPLGRKSINVARARRLRQQGLSFSAIAKKMRLSRTMVWDRLRA